MGYKFSFYVLGTESFEQKNDENTPSTRQSFIDDLKQKLDADCQVANLYLMNDIDKEYNESLQREHKIATAKKYFVDKHESMFVKYGYVNMQSLSTYNIKVSEI